MAADGLVKIVLILLAIWLALNIAEDVMGLLENSVVLAGIALIAILWYLDWI